MKLSERQQRWLVRPIAFFLWVLGVSWRKRNLGVPAPRPEKEFIDALCHGHMLFFLTIYRRKHCVTLVSEHRDGQMIADVVGRFGGAVARGSSTRGGARAYLNLLKNHKDTGWVVTPDGPRGPRGVVQEGIIKMASHSGRAIRPHGYAAAHAKRFRSWDRLTVPYPFSRIVQFVGEPLRVPPGIDREEGKRYAKELERRLADATRQAELALRGESPARERPGDPHDAAGDATPEVPPLEVHDVVGVERQVDDARRPQDLDAVDDVVHRHVEEQ